jgi:YVTN family beta-propeller protein
MTRDGSRVFTANGLTDDVSVVDTRTGAVTSTIKVGRRPWGIAIVDPRP